MRIIEGEHFVDGGPACDTCHGDGYSRHIMLRDYKGLRQEKWLDFPVRIDKRGKCRSCYGMKVKHVESWTADECAEWLWNHSILWIPEAYPYDDVATGQVERVMLTIKINKELKPRIITYHIKGWEMLCPVEGKDLTAALHAAVIAVAKWEDNLPKNGDS